MQLPVGWRPWFLVMKICVMGFFVGLLVKWDLASPRGSDPRKRESRMEDPVFYTLISEVTYTSAVFYWRQQTQLWNSIRRVLHKSVNTTRQESPGATFGDRLQQVPWTERHGGYNFLVTCNQWLTRNEMPKPSSLASRQVKLLSVFCAPEVPLGSGWGWDFNRNLTLHWFLSFSSCASSTPIPVTSCSWKHIVDKSLALRCLSQDLLLGNPA